MNSLLGFQTIDFSTKNVSDVTRTVYRDFFQQTLQFRTRQVRKNQRIGRGREEISTWPVLR